jgi:uncharacterized protein YecE (DUF72 family)
VVRIGPAGWDYPDWQGTVYPKPKPRGFDPLAYLSRYFKTIEVNSSFYGPVKPEVARTWATRVDGAHEFRFTAKLYRRFTHERGTPWTKTEVAETRAGLDVLAERQRLGAVLLQFPWSFRRSDDNQAWLKALFAAFPQLPLVLEVRHASWSDPAVMQWLGEAGVGLVNVDQPLFGNSIKPTAHATSPVGYVRLHGRNYKDWFRKSAGRDERYDYLYNPRELHPWVERIREIAARTEDVYAVTNNHHLGKAPANAEMIEAMFTGQEVEAPPVLFQTYARELAPYAHPSPG